MPSQTNGITVRESPQPEFCNTIRVKADIPPQGRDLKRTFDHPAQYLKSYDAHS